MTLKRTPKSLDENVDKNFKEIEKSSAFGETLSFTTDTGGVTESHSLEIEPQGFQLTYSDGDVRLYIESWDSKRIVFGCSASDINVKVKVW